MEFEVIEGEKLRAMEGMVKAHRRLSVDAIVKINRAIGMLFSMLELKMKFTKMVTRIS